MCDGQLEGEQSSGECPRNCTICGMLARDFAPRHICYHDFVVSGGRLMACVVSLDSQLNPSGLVIVLSTLVQPPGLGTCTRGFHPQSASRLPSDSRRGPQGTLLSLDSLTAPPDLGAWFTEVVSDADLHGQGVSAFDNRCRQIQPGRNFYELSKFGMISPSAVRRKPYRFKIAGDGLT